MATDGRKRHVVSYENMSDEVAAAFAEKYPRGFNDYLVDLVKYPKPDGSFFYAVTIEIPDGIYLVKLKVDTDDTEDLQNWLDGEDDSSAAAITGAPSDPGDGDSLPDDNIAQYSTGDDSSDSDD
ncbi:MAG: hypothetical protein ACI3ZF_04915 [Candidatus Cryptobacteroides sp.]